MSIESPQNPLSSEPDDPGDEDAEGSEDTKNFEGVSVHNEEDNYVNGSDEGSGKKLVDAREALKSKNKDLVDKIEKMDSDTEGDSEESG